MQITELIMATPHYVLLDHKSPFGPGVADPIADIKYSAIFGFSDKVPYDHFCRECTVALTPYPLVKGYLRNQLASAGDADANGRCVKLVILDAPGPREPCVHAATIQAVLDAQETGKAHITPTHQLTFSAEANTYRLEETP